MSVDNLALLYTARISHRFRRLKGLNIRLWTTVLSNAAGCILVHRRRLRFSTILQPACKHRPATAGCILVPTEQARGRKSQGANRPGAIRQRSH